ncbi:SDR family NAD(P)-dependent oxidoreductase [Acuticoccus mangrovi]|uniref:SDR family NAD(P)-dependent oxidoreductase n=1 Tax=Acuticoccus mangrovi TaxID=2796142 RepID=A0A934IVL8_9HYPH|nr:SDR family NAD(P)-dependent oxidoreductase [Acuticoccus mangrovi]MBJ3778845.1 SDR family NAD(P)-dependent oxidoreductase [Acuticoccus mangrovi]
MSEKLKRPPRPDPQAALVTGATGGIGEAFARALPAETGLVLTGRDAARLAELKAEFGTRAEIVPADLATAEGIAAVADAAERFGCDLLVNNAGLGAYGAFLEVDFEEHRRALRVNVEAAMELVHRVVPGMLARAHLADRRAGLINVASSTAFFPVPRLATYAASKAMILAFTESFSAEMSGEPIDILASCPGAVRTEFGHRAGYRGGAIPGAMAPDKVARASLAALGRQKTVVIGPLSAATFTPVALARSVFGDALMRATRVMDRVGR